MDVSALYPSVPQEEGLVSLRGALDRRPDQSVSTEYLVKMMRVVLTKMTSFFGGQEHQETFSSL